MDFQLNDEFVTEHNLSPEQVTAITGHVTGSFVPELKKGWDGKANTDAENILNGAVKYTQKALGVDLQRNQGEKVGDYFSRLSDTYFSDQKTAFEKKQQELEDKLKNFKGSDELKAQYEKAITDLDAAQQQLAELEPLKGLDEKYNKTVEELTGLKLSTAFNSEKPNFPDTVNPYEADAKWNAFKDAVLKDNNIEIVDGVAVAVDKENPHKTTKLSDLVSKSDELTKLIDGRQQKGSGGKPRSFGAVEGVPFKVPTDATSEEKTKLVREYLTKEKGLPVTDPTYSKQFKDLYGKISAAPAA